MSKFKIVICHLSFLISHFSFLISYLSFFIYHLLFKQRLLINLLKGLKMCIINIANVLLVVKILIKKILFFWFSVLDKIRLSSRSATTLISQQPWKHKAAATLISNHKLQNNCSLKKYISEHKCKNYVNWCEFMDNK